MTTNKAFIIARRTESGELWLRLYTSDVMTKAYQYAKELDTVAHCHAAYSFSETTARLLLGVGLDERIPVVMRFGDTAGVKARRSLQDLLNAGYHNKEQPWVMADDTKHGMPTVPEVEYKSEPDKREFSHYFRDVRHLDFVDVYRVLAMFPTGSAAIDHAAKKLLCGGQRGAKDRITDYKEAIASIERAIEMLNEDEPKEQT